MNSNIIIPIGHKFRLSRQAAQLSFNTKDVFPVKIIGASMFPFLPDGSVVQASFCGFSDIHSGDIAVFKRSGDFICHRVVKKIEVDGKLFLKTKPDISFVFDLPVKQEELAGKVTSLKKGSFDIKINNSYFRIFGLLLSFTFPFILHPFFYSRTLIKKLCAIR